MGQNAVDSGFRAVASSERPSNREVGAPHPKTVAGVCKTRGLQNRDETVNRLGMVWSDEEVAWHLVWRETCARLDCYRQRIKEGADLDAANDFARYVLNSRLIVALRAHDNSGPCKVDSSLLEYKANELRQAVCDLWASGQAVPEQAGSQFEAILHRLDLIAGRLAKVPIPSEQRPVDLAVLEGGATS